MTEQLKIIDGQTLIENGIAAFGGVQFHSYGTVVHAAAGEWADYETVKENINDIL